MDINAIHSGPIQSDVAPQVSDCQNDIDYEQDWALLKSKDPWVDYCSAPDLELDYLSINQNALSANPEAPVSAAAFDE